MTFTTNKANSSAQLNKPVLQESSQDEAVKELQTLLNHYSLGEEIAIDGIFDKATTHAVQAFQYVMLLNQDGIVGDKTWRALYKGAPVDMPILQKGSQGFNVILLQRKLSLIADYRGAFDGDFGIGTEAAVKLLQKLGSLTVDGIVGDGTWFELSKQLRKLVKG
jgi:peptidoglycan hydrolase-like protein with peptidoglycan-binding domain